MFTIALASTFNGFLIGMAIGGLGFGQCMAVDLALVADVLPDQPTLLEMHISVIEGSGDRGPQALAVADHGCNLLPATSSTAYSVPDRSTPRTRARRSTSKLSPCASAECPAP